MMVRTIAALLLITATCSARAADPPSIASINLCTDQLLMTLADPAQILGLSPYARDAARSWKWQKAARFARLSGEAEDVLMLRPDIVVAGSYTKRATRELLKDKGLRVLEFDVPRSMDEVHAQIVEMGAVVGHPDRAASEVAKLDAAIARARAIVARRNIRVLALSRRGWVSGTESLTGAMLAAVGLRSAAGDLGLKDGGFASLEAVISLKPDYLLLSESSDVAEDEGRAFLLHPALERFYPASKRLVIAENLINCGGPMISEALDRLATELERLMH